MRFNFTDVYPVQTISIFLVYLGILLWQVIIIMKYDTAMKTYLCINTKVDSSNWDPRYQLEITQSQQIELCILEFDT